MHGMISPSLPSATFRGISGSAIMGLHASQKSMVPSAMARSGMSGVNCRNAIITGTFTAFSLYPPPRASGPWVHPW